MYNKVMRYGIGILLFLIFFIINLNKFECKLLSLLPESFENKIAMKYKPPKYWLHQVNSVEKLIKFWDKYPGMEFDVIYHEYGDEFVNAHDSTGEFAYNNLENQFKECYIRGGEKNIWLDFKNLNEGNKKQACYRMLELMSKYKINLNKVYIESSDWQSLEVFKSAGFKTSYYFPYYDFEILADDEISKIRSQIIKITKSGNVNAISFDVKYYDFINSMHIPTNIEFLVWDASHTWYQLELIESFKELKKDSRIKVILVKE